MNIDYLEQYRSTKGAEEALQYLIKHLQIPDNVLYLESKGLIDGVISGRIKALRFVFGDLFDAYYRSLQVSEGHEELSGGSVSPERVVRSRGRSSQSVRGSTSVRGE